MQDRIATFVGVHPDAAMITLRPDGSAHMARIEAGVVEGHLWATGSPTLVRTRHLRRDPRCSLFVFGPHPQWLGLEGTVTILAGPGVPDQLIRLLRARHKDAAPRGMVLGHDDALGHDRLYSEAEYLAHVAADPRVIFQFEVRRAYGNY